ncbi:hypothetical protein RND81_13G036000 [Saponaria officinalis]|uniref:Retrotransposon gag domain-containing protein n=1 Tax=Saponaria officinalis TaxID=3572 RepID=A0AAW1H027_SAPOF
MAGDASTKNTVRSGASTKDRLTALDKAVNEKIPALESLVIELRRELDTRETVMKKMVTSHENQLRALEDALSEHLSNYESLKVAHKEEMTFLHRRVEELTETCSTLEEKVNTQPTISGARKVKEPPPRTFCGTRDSTEIDNFIFDMEQYFRVSQLDEELKIDMASMYLVDDAKLWWRSKYAEIEARAITMDKWDDFKKALKDQLYPMNTGFAARRKLESLKHTTSIREYVKAFSACMLEIKDMSEDDRVFQFIDGLKDWAQVEIMRDRHATVSAAMAAAERLVDYRDERESAPKMTTFSWNGGNQSGLRDSGSQAVTTSVVSNKFRQSRDSNQGGGQASSSSSGKTDASTTKKPLKCFFCSGPHRMMECPHKGDFDATRFKLATLTKESEAELAAQVEEADEHAFYQPEMHYMGSIQRLSSMVNKSDSDEEKSPGRLYVDMMINGRQARALIDTGATHNYVALGEVKRLGMVWDREEDYVMKSVNSSAKRICGMAGDTSVQLGSWKGRLDFSVVRMDDSKLILGLDFMVKTKTVVVPQIQSLYMMGPKPIVIKLVTLDNKGKDPRLSARPCGLGSKRGRPRDLVARDTWRNAPGSAPQSKVTRTAKGSVEPKARPKQAASGAQEPTRPNTAPPRLQGVEPKSTEQVEEGQMLLTPKAGGTLLMDPQKCRRATKKPQVDRAQKTLELPCVGSKDREITQEPQPTASRRRQRTRRDRPYEDNQVQDLVNQAINAELMRLRQRVKSAIIRTRRSPATSR